MLKYHSSVFVIVIITAVWLVAGSLPVLAADYYGLETTAGEKGAGFNKQDTLYSTIGKVTSAILAAIAIVFFVLTFYAGLRWMTARGNEEMATKAKETLEAAVIGLLIVVGSYALSNFILGKLGGGG